MLLKTIVAATSPWVRIPRPPPCLAVAIQERGDSRYEPPGVIKPRVMTSSPLNQEEGRGEQGSHLANYPGRPLRVKTTRKDQHGRAELGKHGAGAYRVKRSLGGKTARRVLARLRLSRGPVSLCARSGQHGREGISRVHRPRRRRTRRPGQLPRRSAGGSSRTRPPGGHLRTWNPHPVNRRAARPRHADSTVTTLSTTTQPPNSTPSALNSENWS
jgi:hypothetical protein